MKRVTNILAVIVKSSWAGALSTSSLRATISGLQLMTPGLLLLEYSLNILFS
jgi:hypothetical protein